MQIPVQISVKSMRHTAALDMAIREKAAKLDLYYPKLVSCHVALELAGRHKRHGREFVARIGLKVPGGELAVTRQHDEDLQVALRDAFRAARRRLEDYARTQRGDVKKRSGRPMLRAGRRFE
jgi:ribosome-associated translation inhibitor RaiA